MRPLTAPTPWPLANATMDESFGFAPPPFQPGTALTGLQRSLRDLRLTEREGRVEWRGRPLFSLRAAPDAIEVSWLGPATRKPDWTRQPLRGAADVRRFLDDLKRHLARADDRDE